MNTPSNSSFDDLIQEALSQKLVGWDFHWLNQRTRETSLPWDYRQIVLDRIQRVHSLLDLGTGGGEFLASLVPLPKNTWATEGYPPNVTIARQKLEPLGVQVVNVSESEELLPFENTSFDLLTDRHTGSPAPEVYRVLRLGGRFITQQVGGENCMDLNRFFQDQPYFRYSDTSLTRHVQDLEAAGFQIISQQEAFPIMTFFDISGVVFYLKAISWQIEDFSVEKYQSKLFQLHQKIQKEGGVSVKEHRYLIEAEKRAMPPGS